MRQLRSGQWQARYRDRDGIRRPADETFPTKTQAEQWLTRPEADLLSGDCINPDAVLISFGEYATDWIRERPGLRPATVQVCGYVLRRHLLPGLGKRALSEVREAQVRHWRRNLLDGESDRPRRQRPTRLLKAIMNTAVDDGLIRRNPCRIKGAVADGSPERAVLTIRRSDIDLGTRTARVQRTLTYLSGGGHTFGLPKSAAGRRTVAFPQLISTDLASHLERFTARADSALILTSPNGAPLRPSNFRRRIWAQAGQDARLPATHFHDLRHTGRSGAR